VETIVTIQRDYGDRTNRKHARMKYVVEERGIDWFRHELEQRLGRRVQDPLPLNWSEAEDHLGWHIQHDGCWYLGLHIENGRIKDGATQRLRSGLSHAIAQFHLGVRLTPQQNILLTDIPTELKAPLTSLLASYGIPTDPEEVGTHRFAMACPALPTCGLALAEAERVLPELVEQIEADLRELGLADEPLSIRMTGCPNGCARPYMGDIGFVGRTKGIYNVYIGGDRQNTRLNTLYAPSVRFEHLAATVRPLLALWKEERALQEAFGDFCARVGMDYLHSRVELPALNGNGAHKKLQPDEVYS
jgi:sulfite reductase (ferredoxin)